VLAIMEIGVSKIGVKEIGDRRYVLTNRWYLTNTYRLPIGDMC
jgi:hypothetical protein